MGATLDQSGIVWLPQIGSSILDLHSVLRDPVGRDGDISPKSYVSKILYSIKLPTILRNEPARQAFAVSAKLRSISPCVRFA